MLSIYKVFYLFTFAVYVYVRNGARFGLVPSESSCDAEHIVELVKHLA